ncbi:ATP-binding cassette domain-containing protein [Salipiger sp. IMCC34102]|uniref:ABC transporter transmembrane domain-containing protein n=1 Tax=Salipiger sp. IMCC34102 TaxID=2510647 RepID=UPI00101B9C66|nr:ABC transporter transmembrane domain-containing protein [Salipiger sp. IMCC34102]RYH01266.1 ATP-binding cassette domain-containing protein [Salipiger sp. IMCC34102]
MDVSHTQPRRLTRDPTILAAGLTSNLLGLALPLAIIQVYDRIIPREGFQTLTVLAFGLVTAALADLAVRQARSRLIAAAGARFELAAYTRAFRALLQRDARFDALDPGTLHDRIASIELIRRHNSSEMTAAMLDVPFIALFIGVMTLISPVMGGAICALAAVSITAIWLQRRQVLRLNADRRDRDRRRHSFLVETLRGIEMIKGLGIEAQMQRRYEKLMAVNAWITARLSGRISLTQGTTAAIGLLAPALMSCVGAALVLRGEMSVGAVAAIVLLTGRVIQPLLRIEALVAGGRDLRTAQAHVAELTRDHDDRLFPVTPGRIDRIDLRRVALAADPDAAPHLRGLTLSLQRGDCVALSGDDGSGRSLLLRALAGLVPPAEGRIMVDGIPMGRIDPDALASRVAYLRSDYTMLDGTLLENLTGFEVEAHRDAALALTRELGIDGFLAQHPAGLSMKLAANAAGALPASVHDAVFLIAGLARQPDVILFDEANANLDHQIDRAMIEVLRRRIPDAITVLVTRRPSYLALAGRHLAVTKGGLIEAVPADLSPRETDR